MATPTLETAMPEQTILGCPASSYHSFESVCSVTAAPACAASTSINYDAACCGSLTTYALSLEGCVAAHAPTCLDTVAVFAYLSAIATTGSSNPCAQFAGPVTSAAATLSSASSAASSASSTATAAGSSSTTAAAAAGSAASTSGSSATASTASASATPKSGAPKVGAGFKVYVAVALVGALAVLAM